MAGQPAPHRGRTDGGGSGPLESARSAGEAGASGSSCGLAAAAHHRGLRAAAAAPGPATEGPLQPLPPQRARDPAPPPATAGSGSAPPRVPALPAPAGQWAPRVAAGRSACAGEANRHKPGGRRLRLPAGESRLLGSLDILENEFY